jgi:hypothetical protein
MKVTPEIAISRMQGAAQALDQYKRKIYKLRRIVLGDIGALESEVTDNQDDGFHASRQFKEAFADVMVTDVEEARSNEMLKALKTLVFQTAYYFPEIEVKGVEPEEAAVTAGYCKYRMREKPFGCNARPHARLSLFDYCIGGLGFGYTPMWEGKPSLRYVDTLDVLWDQTAKVISDIGWGSVTVCQPLSRWLPLLGSKLNRFMVSDEKTGKVGDIDRPFEIEFYYDLDGDSGAGHYYLFAKTGSNNWDERPIFAGPNPCYFELAGERHPFLPLEPMFFMDLPSTRFPQGLTEQMLPSQLAVWRADRMTRDIIDRGAGFYEAAKTEIDEKEREKFEQGDTAGILYTKSGKAISVHPSLQVDQQILAYRQQQSMEITEQSGANPFAMGDRVEGAEYAAQIHAIQGNAGLTSGTISRDHAGWWERNVRKFVGKGKLYDNKPIVIPYDGVDFVFDQSDPVSQYLRPDAEFTVREDSMKFRSRNEMIMEAKELLNTAMTVQQFFPKATLLAYRRYLEAFNEQSPEKWMEGSPLAAPPPTGGQATAAALLSGMSAMAGGGAQAMTPEAQAQQST